MSICGYFVGIYAMIYDFFTMFFFFSPSQIDAAQREMSKNDLFGGATPEKRGVGRPLEKSTSNP